MARHLDQRDEHTEPSRRQRQDERAQHRHPPAPDSRITSNPIALGIPTTSAMTMSGRIRAWTNRWPPPPPAPRPRCRPALRWPAARDAAAVSRFDDTAADGLLRHYRRGASAGDWASVGDGSHHRCALRRAFAALVGGAGDHRRGRQLGFLVVGEDPAAGLRNRMPSGASRLNPPPRPGTTSMTSWVCFHAWNCGPEIHTGTPSARRRARRATRRGRRRGSPRAGSTSATTRRSSRRTGGTSPGRAAPAAAPAARRPRR